MATRGGTGVYQTTHELAERGEVERHVLDVVDDVVAPSAGHLHAFFVAAGGGVVVDGLTALKQLDGLVDAPGLVLGHGAGRVGTLAEAGGIGELAVGREQAEFGGGTEVAPERQVAA